MESAIWDWAKTQGPLVAVLVAILVTGARQMWVWGWHYREMRADRDQWRTLYFRAVGLAEQAVGVVSQAVVPR